MGAMLKLKKKEGWKERFQGWLGKFRTGAISREELEALLFEADLSAEVVDKLCEVAKHYGGKTEDELIQGLQREIVSLLGEMNRPATLLPTPGAILLVGVNGAGKTTVAGRLAYQFHKKGYEVILAAGDTFRAGAIEQLKKWGERADVEVVAQKEGADPAAVIFDAWQRSVARNALLIADTAGRLHTKSPLMEEIKKVVRVLGKDGRGAPHETFLVLDATLGQNSIAQAREFQKAVPLTGLILTKMDGTARGGAALASSLELKLPIRYLGVGEQAIDLVPFDAIQFAQELLSA